MKKHVSRVLLVFLFIPALLFSQPDVIVSGTVTSGNSKAVMIVQVNVPDSHVSALSDSSGKFRLSLSAGIHKLILSGAGYVTDTIQLNLVHDTAFVTKLKDDLMLKEVTVTGYKQRTGAQHNADGTVTLNKESFDALPAFLGENDPVHAVQMQPGVQSGSEGARGIFVRGGGPDQTLILLDGTPVYNPSHIDGFLSVFNGDAIEGIDVYKDVYPAQYTGRLSAVVDIKMHEGDTTKITGSFSLGVLDSRFHLEGPFTKNRKATFSVSARGCYAGLFTWPLSEKQFQANSSNGGLWYYFADVNAKLVYHVSSKTQIQLNFFSNSDFYYYHQQSTDSGQTFTQQSYNEQHVKWANYTASARLLQTLNALWKITHHFSFSRYIVTTYEQNNYNALYPADNSNNYYNNNTFNTTASLNDFDWHTDAVYTAHKQIVNLGAGLTGMVFSTGGGYYNLNNIQTGNQVYQLNGTLQQSLASFIYASDQIHAGKRWDITAGARAGTYFTQGKTFLVLLPDARVVFNPVDNVYLRASGCGVSQNMHLLTASSSNVLNDYWVPATAAVKPETGWNFSGGIAQKLPLNFEWSVDGFYRLMNNVIDYTQEVTETLVYQSWQNQVTAGGKGRSYGTEVYLSRSSGRVTGSIAYTLAWSDRRFPSLNDGNYFSYEYDRRHNLAAQVAVNLGKHIQLSSAFVYGSGNMVTLPVLTYQTYGSINSYFQAVQNNLPYPGGETVNVYGGRNNYRLPSYQHLDVAFTWYKKARLAEHIFNFSVYNVYNHFNQFAIYPVFQTNANGTINVLYKQVSVFPVTPSISYTIKFG